MTWPVTIQTLEALGQQAVADSAGALAGFSIAFDELTLTAPAGRVVQALTLLRDKFGFAQLIDLCGVDYPERPMRFDVVYHLLSLTKNQRLRLKVQTDEDTAVPTVIGVYPCADWYEREAFDMYGIFFEGHPDLRRILTDYGFHGHPLRKDFPMTGYVELRYDDELKRVVYEPVKSVEFRNWDFLSPWEGADYILPGDEKSPGTGGPHPGAPK
ncbi:MAG: NADH-quinone oxidoreductase subunit C [Phenylobacterium sp.]|jgi:NADH-quinone oxidoreductase subunit C|uniref:NADH-quinone oxidoreductase subunit C n=1 Tax=Phenylobacterium sp. TaxID=1871053 RepID=UPI001B5A1AED|nr:NADH-quinone oxidoreductase subunit C [Phenylobacterium sp.]MBP7648806.1 NADH-quinone oxidoreductase subunit C [Phenylobacterium sp.]MBP7815172.1 NADH-quinone oxidoreductase subunit C [Phenylobacterium sp.]MBP9755097.1 NADH-quinone oxidoreductase subunit C [Phenylobacterium sp.]